MALFRNYKTNKWPMENNKFQNPNWPGANHLAIYKRGRGFELRNTVNKSS